jgi:hypothetical protein
MSAPTAAPPATIAATATAETAAQAAATAAAAAQATAATAQAAATAAAAAQATAATPQGYVATHYTGTLQAATGCIAKEFAKVTLMEQRRVATTLHTFLADPQSDLRDLNGDQTPFTAMISVPGTHKLKILFGLGYGTSGIGQVSPIAKRLLALFGEGSAIMGPAQVISLDPAIRAEARVLNLTDAEIQTVFQTGNHLVDQKVEKANNVTNHADILRIAAIPTYLVYDGFNKDLDAAEVYERVMDCQEASDMRTHALAFLRSCMIGGWRLNDAKPFIATDQFYGMVPPEARVWANQQCRTLFPTIMGTAPAFPFPPAPTTPAPGTAPRQVTPPGSLPQGSPSYTLDASAIQQLIMHASSANVIPSQDEAKKSADATEFKVSDAEKARMRAMCGLDASAPDAAFPKWFRDLFAKNQDEKDRAHIISHAIERTFMYEDAEVPLYPSLVKMILTRKWTGNDLGRRPAYIHAAAGLSPFAMVDLSEDDVALMQQDYDDLTSASSVSPSEYRAARAKLVAKTPEDGDSFMLMLKRYVNFLFALFQGASPLYKLVKGIVDALREYSPNARSKLTVDVKSAILWIILLQARRFAQGKMIGETPCLGEFIHMSNLVKAKSCEMISHIEVPTDLLRPSKKRSGAAKTVDTTNTTVKDADPFPKKGKATPQIQPYSQELKKIFDQPMKDANYPGINRICEYCAVSKEAIIPNMGRDDCIQYLLTGNCKYGKQCKFHHKTATKAQVIGITAKLDRFLKDPSGIKGEKKE